MGSGMADGNHAEMAQTYAKHAADMKAQAQRAETVYLQAIYASIAGNWDRLAAQMQIADRTPSIGKASRNLNSVGSFPSLARLHRTDR